MGKRSPPTPPPPPPPPDPTVLLREQGRLNEEELRRLLQANRVDQVTPWATTRWDRPTDPNGTWTQRTEYTPDIMELINRQLAFQRSVNDAATPMLGGVVESLRTPFAPNLREMVSDVRTSPVSGDISTRGLPEIISSLRPIDYQTSVDLSKLQSIPGLGDFGGERDRAEQAVYDRYKSRLDPEFDSRKRELEVDLANRGIMVGSEQYRQLQDQLGRERSDAYSNARREALGQGAQEQSRLFNLALSGRRQGMEEEFGKGEFANRAAQSLLADAVARANVANQARGTMFGERATQAQLAAQAAQANFAQQMASSQFANQTRQQQLMEQLMQRYLPLQDLYSLLGLGEGGGGIRLPIPGLGGGGAP